MIAEALHLRHLKKKRSIGVPSIFVPAFSAWSYWYYVGPYSEHIRVLFILTCDFASGIGLLLLLSMPSSYGFLTLQNLWQNNTDALPQQSTGSPPPTPSTLLLQTPRLPSVMRSAPLPPMHNKWPHTPTTTESPNLPNTKVSHQSNSVMLPGPW